jgi:hypothetical protein
MSITPPVFWGPGVRHRGDRFDAGRAARAVRKIFPGQGPARKIRGPDRRLQNRSAGCYGDGPPSRSAIHRVSRRYCKKTEPSVSPELGGSAVASPAAYSAAIVGFRNPARLSTPPTPPTAPVTPMGRL